MKLLATTITLLSLLALVSANAEQAKPLSSGSEQTVEITRSGLQPSSKLSAEHFSGSVRIDPLFNVHDPARTSGACVTFEPGARTAWHSHPLGQILIVTAGSGG